MKIAPDRKLTQVSTLDVDESSALEAVVANVDPIERTHSSQARNVLEVGPEFAVVVAEFETCMCTHPVSHPACSCC
jgi:hypothetical protein